MKDINDIKTLIIFILIADIIGGIIYCLKGNVVGIFNCIAWATIATFILVNFKKVFNK